MKPEDVDKLFNERLGKMSPTPSPDLWNRLQQRMEDEFPGAQEKKPIMMWTRSYAAAAAISVLLSAGVVFYSVQHKAGPETETIAQATPEVKEDKATDPIQSDQWVNKSIAVTPVEASNAANPVTSEKTLAKVDESNAEPVAKLPSGKGLKQVERKQSAVVNNQKPMLAATLTRKPRTEPEPAKVVTPEPTVAFTSANMNAAPVEIIIKLTVDSESSEAIAMANEEPDSDFQKKRTLAKNIFKQVKNLSNGEQVSLSELGVNADRIALETQIGKQKISKVINL